MATVLVALCAAAPVHAADVVGQWRLDDPADAQRLIDDGPFGLDGQLGDTGATDAFDPERIAGLSGGALRFDGGQYVRLPVAAELAPRTLSVEAVTRGPASPGEFRYVIVRGATGCFAGSYGLYTARSGGMAFYVFDGRDYVVSASARPSDVWNGEWHHVAGVFDGDGVRLYVDGRPVGDPMPAPMGIAYRLTSDDMYFGIYRGSCTLPMAGDLDLVRIWSGALGAGVVAALSDAALEPPAGPGPPSPEPPREPPAQEPRNVLPPAEPGRTIDGGTPPATAPPNRSGAPLRACTLRAAVVRRAKRHLVKVRVTRRGRPLGRVRVVARGGKKRKVVGSARTGRDGRASIRLVRGVRGKVRLAVAGRSDCSMASVRVRS